MELPRTARGRQLAARLRELRLAANRSFADVYQGTGVTKSTMHRIEAGQTVPQPRTLNPLLTYYGVKGDELAELKELARLANDRSGWIRRHANHLPDEYVEYVDFENEAIALDTFEISLVPGLLQTPDYARAVIAGTLHDATPEDVERRVEVRRLRQEVLIKPDPVHLNAVIHEAALLPAVGGHAVMAAQLRSLAAEGRPNVLLRVIPLSAGAHPGMIGSFVYMRFGPQAADLVYTELLMGEMFREDVDELKRYRAVYEHLEDRALDLEESRALIETVARKHKRGQ